MTKYIWARPLTPEEDNKFRKSDLGRKAASLGPMAIMGPADHPYIKDLNIEIKLHKVHLGGGQFIYDGPSIPPATEGRTIPVVWTIDSAYGYLLAGANSLDIQVLYDPIFPQHHNPLYFERIYVDAFIESFNYADWALGEWFKNRSFLGRWFGDMVPEKDSNEAKAIRRNVIAIMSKKK